MKLNRVLALCATALAISAQAAAIAVPGGNLGTLTLFPALYSNEFPAPAPGSLANVYSFTLGTSAKLTGSIYGASVAPLSIASVVIGNGSSSVASTLTGSIAADAWGFTTGPLAAGTYTLTISAPSGTLAGYWGSVYATAAPVPEPASMALVLGGLAVIGFAARKRSA
jgi:PEP-CTERM motif